jgi:hypothetical protein
VVDGRFRRVKVFRLSFFKDPSTESNHALIEVKNREKDSSS